MKLNKNISIGLLVAALILIALAAPATAYDSTIAATWQNSTTAGTDILVNTDQKLTYQVHANEQTLGGNYIFTVKLDHNNSTHTESTTGFDITGYTNAAAYPGVILNVELKNGGKEIIYTLKDPTLLQIDLIVRANARYVYPDEVVDITALLKHDVGGGSIPVSDVSLTQARCTYPTTTTTGNYELTNPTLMPVGASNIDFNYIFYTDGTMNSLRSSGGLTIHNKGYTLDFSGVNITVNGNTQTYAAWLNDSAGSPVTFTYSDNSSLSADHLLKYTSAVTSNGQLSWGTRLPFKAITTAGFDNTPKIDFSGLKAYGELQYNGRGPNVPVSPTTTTEPMKTISSGTFTGEPAYKTHVSLLRPISGNNQYIYANSISASHSHLQYQELFKSFITSTERNGTPNVTVTYEIPAGVTITHIRIPESDGNDETKYGKISLVKGGVTYDLGNGGMVLDLANNTLGIPPFASGESVVFEFEDVLKIKPHPGSQQSYYRQYSLSFIGTTDSSVGNGASLTFKAKTNETVNVWSLPATMALSGYHLTSYMTNIPHLVGDENNTAVTAIEREKPFYFYVGMQTPSYPYNSAHRTDIANGANTGVFSSPVFYFSLPAGVKHSGAGAAEIVNSAGNSLTLKNLNGNTITPRITNVYSNAGLYPGGTLVEVKLEDAANPNNPFWLRGTAYVRLKVFVESGYDGADTITIQPASILMSSWDPDGVETWTGGSGGRVAAIPAAPVKIHVGQNGTYTQYLGDKTLSVLTPESVQVTVSVMTPSGNLTYTPGDDSSYPGLKAGSLHETFKIYFSNSLSGVTFDDADVFFILPKEDKWKPNLNNPATLNAVGFASTSDYTIQYTTDAINFADIGDTSQYNYTSLQPSSFTWKTMNFTGNTADAIPDNLEDITAIRVHMNLAGSESLELQLPFELPKMDASSGINYGDTARGQTIYYLNSTLSHDNTYTAAVKLVKSEIPKISAVDSSTIPAPFLDAPPIDYKTGTIPNWYEFYTYDDFTEDLKIKEVQVSFTPYFGDQINRTISESDMTNISYVPKKAGSGGPEVNTDFVKGFEWTIPSPTTYVDHGKPGVYRITYITAEDDDSQKESVTLNITMKKDSSTIGITATDTSILWNTSLGTTVDEYFRPYVTVTDADGIISSRVLLESDGGLNLGVPGNYTLKYNYTDAGNNVINTTMKVSVLFNGTLEGTVLGNGIPVDNFGLDIDGTVVTTDSFGYYGHEVTALVTSPTAAPYNITFDSLIPAGLNYSTSSPMPITGSGSLSIPAPTQNINFDAVSMTVNITGGLAATGVRSVKLYHDSYLSPIAVNDSVTGDVVFEKAAGEGWFESGLYYFVVELNPGYRLNTSADFSVNSSILDLETAQILLDNDDILVSLDVEIAPMISGFVWADVDRDSSITSGEAAIVSATVSLYDAAGTTLVNQTATDSEGYYYFIDLDETLEYIVEVQMPSGFNRVSALTNDQKLNSGTLRTDPIDFLGGFHVTDVDAGFYWQSTGGGGNGGGTIVPPNTVPQVGDTNNGGNTVTDDNKPPVQDDKKDPIIEPTQKSNWWWILVLLFVLIVAVCAVYSYNKKRKV